MREGGRGSQEADAEGGGESIKLDSHLPPEKMVYLDRQGIIIPFLNQGVVTYRLSVEALQPGSKFLTSKVCLIVPSWV